MSSYIDENVEYWSSTPWQGENLDHPVFRFYGRVLKVDFFDGSGGERVLDFGCGRAAAVNFFDGLGFDAYGVDASVPYIERAQQAFPHLAERLQPISPQPAADDVWFGGEFDVITSIQALYYFGNDDLEKRLVSLERQLRPGGVFYATMMGTESWYYDNSEPAHDGLRKVVVRTPRLVEENFINFTESVDDLKQRFHMFEPLHTGFYSERYRSDEGPGYHFTFVGAKR